MCECVHLPVCVHVCVCEREREKEACQCKCVFGCVKFQCRQSVADWISLTHTHSRPPSTEQEKERVCVCVCLFEHVSVWRNYCNIKGGLEKEFGLLKRSCTKLFVGERVFMMKKEKETERKKEGI